MILEMATITVRAGEESAFEVAVGQARPLFARAKGCRGMTLRRGVEEPLTYHLLVEWETLDNHMVDFRESADFQAWRALVGSYFAEPPSVIHSDDVTFPD
jgi:heme-degrading monooxygenase HmoA